MQFLNGSALSKKMRELASSEAAVKMAIAYWGADALTLLALDPKRRNVEVICCLKGGKSDPEIIRKFGKLARQHDQLHAKVIWTPTGAVVGSANASSNGLPEEESHSNGLLEAGIYLTDARQLAAIERWFGKLFEQARSITPEDLEAAKQARERRMWDSGARRESRVPLIQALREGGKTEFHNQEIYLAMYRYGLSAEEERAAETLKNKQIRNNLTLSQAQLDALTCYAEWRELPKAALLIDVHRKSGKTASVSGFYKTFDVEATWGGFTYVLPPRKVFSRYKLTPEDKRTVQSAAAELWTHPATQGDEDGKILHIEDAGGILLKYSTALKS